MLRQRNAYMGLRPQESRDFGEWPEDYEKENRVATHRVVHEGSISWDPVQEEEMPTLSELLGVEPRPPRAVPPTTGEPPIQLSRDSNVVDLSTWHTVNAFHQPLTPGDPHKHGLEERLHIEMSRGPAAPWDPPSRLPDGVRLHVGEVPDPWKRNEDDLW